MANNLETNWDELRFRILETFSPGPPIREVNEFSGRKAIIRDLQDITIERGRHAIIFGERGVGKSSLANVFYKDLNAITRQIIEIPVDADSADSFDSLWRKVFRRIQFPEMEFSYDTYFEGSIEPDHVFLALSRYNQNQMPIIIIDEYDRIQDETCRLLMTDLIKSLSRITTNPTIVLVGVAEDIIRLICDHESIHRNLAQVRIKRMGSDEIREIVPDQRLWDKF